MLTLPIPDKEFYDERTNEFFTIPGQTLEMEHSLISLSKWESKWLKPFLTKDAKTEEETLDYYKQMTLTKNVNPQVYTYLTDSEKNTINEYINNPMSATTVYDKEDALGPSETITSELIYYWMVTLQINFKCERWHLNRLIMLIRVCNFKNKPVKKRTKEQILRDYAAENAARRAKLNSKG